MRQRLTDDFGTHVLRLLAGERRGEAARDDVDEHGLGRERGDGALEELRGLDTLDEADVRARVGGELQADDGLLHAEHLGRVRAADDDLRGRSFSKWRSDAARCDSRSPSLPERSHGR